MKREQFESWANTVSKLHQGRSIEGMVINFGGFDNLSDDLLIRVLSRMSVKEAARTCVLAHRWRYLWRFADGTLRFHHWDTSTGEIVEREQFESWVNTMLKLHQGRSIEGMSINFGGFDNFSDDLLIRILSLMGVKEAARTCVLAHRWRYLWRFANGTLRFHHWDTSTGEIMEREHFESWVNTVLRLHQGRSIEGLVIDFDTCTEDQEEFSSSTRDAVHNWVYFAMNKEVQRLEMKLEFLSIYPFPDLKKLVSSYSLGFSSPFYRLRSLKLVYVDIEDEVVHYFLASCPSLEDLYIYYSYITKKIRVVDPPRLRVLYISDCFKMESLEISAASLVSLTFRGKENNFVLKSVPNLSELNIGDGICFSFVLQPKQHSRYSSQLEKLDLDFRSVNGIYNIPIVASPDFPQLCSLKRLKVKVLTDGRQSLLFFTSLIKASPQLSEFVIKVGYSRISGIDEVPFPVISAANAVTFVHSNLKVVELEGYVGCSAEEEMLELIKIGPLIERVAIDTETYYYVLEAQRPEWHLTEIVATTRNEAIERARHFVSNFPKQIEAIVS